MRTLRDTLADTIVITNPILQEEQKLKPIKFNGADGPYLVNDVLYRVTEKNQFIEQNQFKPDSLFVITDNKFPDEFYVQLSTDYAIPKSVYEMPEKLVAISDIEGNYNAFSGFLISNKVIDMNHDWTFGNGHLVLVGDFVDRGKNVAQVLWLIYKLEHQAKQKGGEVHFILGNHEVLNFQGDDRYNRGKYIKIAQQISGELNETEAIKYMYSDKSEFGKWMHTKNIIEKVGKYIFTHGGLSKEILEYDLTIDDINDKVRFGFNDRISDSDSIAGFLYGGKGPFWYRGLVINTRKYRKATSGDVKEILSFYDAEKIVIGHTFVNEVSKGFDGGVIMLDVPHGNQKFSGRTKGLLIENGKEFIIDDIGKKSGFD